MANKRALSIGSIYVFCIIIFVGCMDDLPDNTPTPIAQTTPISTLLPTDTSTPDLSTPTASPRPTETPTLSIPTNTPTMTYTPSPTSLPISSEKITAENLNQLIEIGRWGNGVNTDVAISPDRQLLATAKPTGIYIYDANTLELNTHIAGNGIFNVEFVPDGTALISGGEDLTRVWDTTDWSEISTFNKANFSIMISPDGKNIALVNLSQNSFNNWSSNLQVFNINSGEKLLDKTIEGYKEKYWFLPDGLIAFNNWESVTFVDSTNGNVVNQLEVENKEISAVAFAQDEKIVALITNSSQIEFFNWETNESLGKIFGVGVLSESIAVSRDLNYVAVGDFYGFISIWDINTKEKLYDAQISFELQYYQMIDQLIFQPEDSKLLSRTRGGFVRRLDVITGEEEHLESNIFDISNQPFSPNGSLLAMSFLNQITIWNLDQNQAWKTITHTNAIKPPLFSPDGTYLVSTDELASLSWNVIDGTRNPIMGGNSSLAVSPNSNWLVAGSHNSIVVSNIKDASIVHQETIGTYYASSSVFSPNGEMVVASNGSENIVIISTNSWEKLFTIPIGDFFINDLTFSPENRYLIARSQNSNGQINQIKIWDVQGKYLVKNIDQPSIICALSFSPDESVVVSIGRDGIVRFIDINNSEELFSIDLGKQSTYFCRLGFSPDGRLLATSFGGVVRLWGLPEIEIPQ